MGGGGANGVSLRLAQRNFYKFGVSEEKYRDRIVNVRYEKDTLWKPIWEIEEKLNKKKLTEIIIEGNILISGFNKSLKIDNFLDEFTVFLENKGYSFGGIIKRNETEIDIEQEWKSKVSYSTNGGSTSTRVVAAANLFLRN